MGTSAAEPRNPARWKLDQAQVQPATFGQRYCTTHADALVTLAALDFLSAIWRTPPKEQRCNDPACQKDRYGTERKKHAGRPFNENVFQQ